VQIWDPATGALQRTLQGHTGWVNGVCAIRVDGRELLASAGDDDTVRMSDPATGVLQRILTEPTDGLHQRVSDVSRQP
jgi:WD40 repeat protein